ncbi:hypothetical protein BJ508DRAFT_412781 [Ascobolus immersus RN42]|uniref:BTB domain-containing protein n=1 Tax=Ascobolus immersus RN42 TaxID=1160509 RepID=A0A3N4IE22_ASCIM|nr:hypothetical protein BJ508DRAFT_412781 [Ascobolus immersus RN42]
MSTHESSPRSDEVAPSIEPILQQSASSAGNPVTSSNATTSASSSNSNSITNGSDSLPPEGSLRVIVGNGSDSTTFTLPIPLLTKNSEYFSSLLSFPGSEQRLRTVTLDIDEIDNPLAFKCFVDFIQSGRYHWIEHYGKHYHYKFQPDPSGFGMILNARVYILAERLLSPEVAKFALEELKEILDNTRFFKKTAFFPTDGLLKATELVYLGTPDRYFNTSASGDHHETTLSRRPDWSKRVKNKYQENIRDIMASQIAKNIKAVNMPEFGRSKAYLNLLMNVPELSIDISMAVYPEMYYVEQPPDASMYVGRRTNVNRAEPERCRVCQRFYPSRNELFRHLRGANHLSL